MTGRFARLNPNSDERKVFWDKNSDKIRALLEEINADVFDGRGKFEKAEFGGLYRIPPQITEPNLYMSFPNRGSLSVCTASTSQLRVIVEKWSLGKEYKSIECEPNILDGVLEVCVKYLVG